MRMGENLLFIMNIHMKSQSSVYIFFIKLNIESININ